MCVYMHIYIYIHREIYIFIERERTISEKNKQTWTNWNWQPASRFDVCFGCRIYAKKRLGTRGDAAD